MIWAPAVYAQSPTTWQTFTGQPVDCIVDGIPTLKCLEAVFSNVVFMASSFVVLILFLMFVVGAISYLTSLGNPEKVKKAQNTLRYAIIGFVLFLSSFIILKTIDYLFLGNQGRIFKFSIENANNGYQQPLQPGGAGNQCAPTCDYDPNTKACVNCQQPQ